MLLSLVDNALRPPIDVKAVAISATSVNVTWQPNPLNNNNAVLAHIVFYEYFTSSLKRAKKERVVGEVSATHWKIDQLLGGRLYFIYLSTYGRNGQKSSNSQVARVRTLESGKFSRFYYGTISIRTCHKFFFNKNQ